MTFDPEKWEGGDCYYFMVYAVAGENTKPGYAIVDYGSDDGIYADDVTVNGFKVETDSYVGLEAVGWSFDGGTFDIDTTGSGRP